MIAGEEMVSGKSAEPPGLRAKSRCRSEASLRSLCSTFRLASWAARFAFLGFFAIPALSLKISSYRLLILLYRISCAYLQANLYR